VRSIELFSCSGGMAEGFRRAGVTFDLAFDADPNACDSYEKNLGRRPIQMDVRDLLRMVDDGWRPGALDLLVADPPCTPYSRAGKRLGPADARDMLQPTIDLIRALRPRAYLIGNVPGLDDANHWHVIQEGLAPLGREGYCIRDYKSLDAADYGVPQHRLRPFWFGHRGGDCLRWPEPSHGAPGQPALPGMSPLRPWVTVREALGHLSPEEMGKPIRLKWQERSDHRPSGLDEPAKALTGNTHGDGALVAPGEHPVSELDAPARTVRARDHHSGGTWVLTGEPPPRKKRPSPRVPQRLRACSPDEPSTTVLTDTDHVGHSSPKVSWPWDRPSTTVQSDARLAPPGHRETSFMSDANAIKLSEKAACILQGFPDGWLLAGKTKESRWGQIGMALPPALAHAVASSIGRWFERAEKTECA
jgi:DNA (cytosine-5)-methyltransferase 1